MVSDTESQPSKLQREVNETIRHYVKYAKPPSFKNLNEYLDFKIDLWEVQYKVDTRIRELFDGFNTNFIENFYDTIILNPYIKAVPFYKQLLMLLTDEPVLYGGARGGGKSEAVLMSALQYVDFPEWRAGIFRLTNPDLVQPKGILNRCEMWAYHDPLLKKEGLQPHYSRKYNIFTFPSGAELKFGHMQHEDDVNKYQGAEFHEISLDECTQFSLNKITKIKGSNRKGEHDPLPLRVRYTGNPGGVSHEFFNNEFIRGDGLYIDSFFFENPYLNHIKYQRNLEEIRETNPVLYEQWRNASWSAKPEGRLFKREWFIQSGYDMINESIIRRVRFWDLASTEVSDTSYSQDPDWTVGVLAWLGKSNTMYIKDVIKFRKDADEVIEKILSTAKQDGYDTAVRIEKEGLSSGNFVAYNFSKLLKAYDFDAIHMGNRGKIARAEAMIHSIKYGTVKVPVAASWLEEYIGELTSFPTKGVHDDQVDATSGAFAEFFEVQESAFDSSDFDRFMDWNELN